MVVDHPSEPIQTPDPGMDACALLLVSGVPSHRSRLSPISARARGASREAGEGWGLLVLETFPVWMTDGTLGLPQPPVVIVGC